MKKIYPALLLPALFSITACGNDICCTIPPNQGKLYFSIKEKGSYLADSLSDKMIMSYYNKGYHVVDPNTDPDKSSGFLYDERHLIQRATDGYGKTLTGLFSSAIIPEVIHRSGIKQFYLTYPNGRTDTLEITMETISEDEADNERCKCIYPFRAMTCNGKPVKEDTSVHPDIYNPIVFLIEK